MRGENVPLTSIRGVVALWVVAHHLVLRFIDTGLGSPDRFFFPGSVGVDMFFILSGLVMGAVYGDLRPSGAGRYLIRRVFRIYPLHLAVMAALVAVAGLRWWAGAPAPGENWSRLPEALLLLQPFRDQPLSWNVASWSIGVEMACYLVFPFVAPLLRALPGRGLAVAVAAFAFVEYLVLTHVGVAVSGPGAVARGLAGFGLGAAMAFALRDRQISGAWRSAGQLLAVAGVIAALWMSAPQLAPLFAAVLIGLLYTGRGAVGALLEAPVLHWAGRISYSIYLVHLPVIGFFALVFPPQATPLAGTAGLLVWSLAAIALVLAVSHVAWRIVEEPCRRYGARLTARRSVVQGGGRRLAGSGVSAAETIS